MIFLIAVAHQNLYFSLFWNFFVQQKKRKFFLVGDKVCWWIFGNLIQQQKIQIIQKRSISRTKDFSKITTLEILLSNGFFDFSIFSNSSKFGKLKNLVSDSDWWFCKMQNQGGWRFHHQAILYGLCSDKIYACDLLWKSVFFRLLFLDFWRSHYQFFSKTFFGTLMAFL